jgi:hypothetical protein
VSLDERLEAESLGHPEQLANLSVVEVAQQQERSVRAGLLRAE